MPEYIERKAILKRNIYGNANPITHRTYAEELIKSMPAADVVEVKHGHWIITEEVLETIRECSCCHCKTYYPKSMRFNCRESPYCEDCGAKMDGLTNKKRLCRTRRRREG